MMGRMAKIESLCRISPIRHIRLIGLIALLSLMACGKLSPEEQASLAAKGYYEHLIEGEWDAYMEGVNGTEGAPADYVEQLRVSAKQYVQRLKHLHQGVQSIEVASARTDSMLQCTQVFLILNFGDATHEEICVPMVESNGRWRMK